MCLFALCPMDYNQDQFCDHGFETNPKSQMGSPLDIQVKQVTATPHDCIDSQWFVREGAAWRSPPLSIIGCWQSQPCSDPMQGVASALRSLWIVCVMLWSQYSTTLLPVFALSFFLLLFLGCSLRLRRHVIHISSSSEHCTIMYSLPLQWTGVSALIAIHCPAYVVKREWKWTI